MAYIWVARFRHHLEQEVVPPEIIVRNIWINLIRIVKFQFNALKDDFENPMLAKLALCQRWKNFHMFSADILKIHW